MQRQVFQLRREVRGKRESLPGTAAAQVGQQVRLPEDVREQEAVLHKVRKTFFGRAYLRQLQCNQYTVLCTTDKRHYLYSFLCRCHQNGFRVEVVHKSSSAKESALAAAFSYVWSGNVLECSNCGVIYRDREKWQGNMEPEKTGDVIAEITHIWPGERSIQGE